MKINIDTKQKYNRESGMWEGPVGERTIEIQSPPEHGTILLGAMAGGGHTVFTFDWEGSPEVVRWIGYLPPDDYQVNLYVDGEALRRVPFKIFNRNDPAPPTYISDDKFSSIIEKVRDEHGPGFWISKEQMETILKESP